MNFTDVTEKNITNKILLLQQAIIDSEFEPKIKKQDDLTILRFNQKNRDLFKLAKTMGIIDE